jgi:beta-phosphoglucomutase
MLSCGLTASATLSIAPGLALLFDVDGVLVDSNPVHVASWAAYLARFGIPFDEETRQRMYGQHNYSLVRSLFGSHLTHDEILAHGTAKEALYREMMAGQLERCVLPGLRDFLAALPPLPLAVASNAERANVDFVLRRAGLEPYVPIALDGSQVERPKPCPDIYLLAAARLAVAPVDCIVFEDSHSGVESARAAGMRVVGIASTHTDLPGVELMIRDFTSPALPAWLAAQRPQTVSAGR